LNEIFFPSIVICNINSLRASFITELLDDPTLSHLTFEELFEVVDKAFIRGKEVSAEEEEVVDRLLK